jgi:hypothetical protein
VIIWDKGFTRPVEAQTTEEEETIVSSPSSWVESSAEEIMQDMADGIKHICSGPMFPKDESEKSTSKGFGK